MCRSYSCVESRCRSYSCVERMCRSYSCVEDVQILQLCGDDVQILQLCGDDVQILQLCGEDVLPQGLQIYRHEEHHGKIPEIGIHDSQCLNSLKKDIMIMNGHSMIL